MKWIAALFLVASTQVSAAQFYSPEINPENNRPTLALRVDGETGQVQVHTRGKWVNARHVEGMESPDNYVEMNTNYNPEFVGWFWNFLFGSTYGYWNSYPSYYYFYSPNYSVWYRGYSYSPYSWYNRGRYWYYSYYWY